MKFCQNVIWKNQLFCYDEKNQFFRKKNGSQIKFCAIDYTSAFVIYELYLGILAYFLATWSNDEI